MLSPLDELQYWADLSSAAGAGSVNHSQRHPPWRLIGCSAARLGHGNSLPQLLAAAAIGSTADRYH
jgi:hypothetical protein